MARANAIEPFPAHLDRDAFGHWLSGFCDGESSFNLYMLNNKQFTLKPAVAFRISLRDDDLEILSLIRSFFACGSLFGHKCSRGVKNGRRVATFSIQAAADVANVVVPHFERFPLRSKKRRDFEIWKDGAALVYRVSLRKQGSNTRKGTRGGIAGVLLKWTAEEREHFKNLCRTLREQRAYSEHCEALQIPQCVMPRALF